MEIQLIRRSIIRHFSDIPDSVPGGSTILLLIVERDRHEGRVQADVLPQLPFAAAQLGLDGLERFEKKLETLGLFASHDSLHLSLFRERDEQWQYFCF